MTHVGTFTPTGFITMVMTYTCTSPNMTIAGKMLTKAGKTLTAIYAGLVKEAETVATHQKRRHQLAGS
jgi:hypothetical protein